VTEILRKVGVVGKFVEYFGPGVPSLALGRPRDARNMSPEYGATCGFFPVDDVTLQYLRLTGRSEERVALVEAYCKENMLWHDPSDHPTYSQVVELDLGDVEPSLAGPRRPQDRVRSRTRGRVHRGARHLRRRLHERAATTGLSPTPFPASDPTTEQQPGAEPEPVEDAETTHVATVLQKKAVQVPGEDYTLEHGSVVIAAITSCTNTSNPSVMIAPGLLAKKAVELGLKRKPWVKSSLVRVEGRDGSTTHALGSTHTSTNSASTPSATAARLYRQLWSAADAIARR